MKKYLPYLLGVIVLVLVWGGMIISRKGVFGTSEETTEKSTESEDIIEGNTTEGEETPDEYICFGSDFHSLTGFDTDMTISYLEDIGEGNYIDIYSTSDDEVYLALDDKQHEFWVNAVEEKIKEQESTLQEISPLYYCNYSDDYTSINLYYDMSHTIDEFVDFTSYACMYCAMYQLIEGSDEISLYLNVYNKDTGKLVLGRDVHEYFTYEVADWSESYHLSNDEETDILSKIKDDSIKTYKIDSNIFDAISTIYIFNIACGNNYDYLYINDEEVIVIGLTEDKQQECLDSLANLVSAEQESFTELGTNYSVNISDDYKVIDFYFDAKLDEQEQLDNFGNFEILCMLYQAIDTGDYYMEFNIYNSENGKLISTGDTETGISWKME